MKSLKILIPALLILAVGACDARGPKETGGTLVGAGLGALLGSQIGGGKGKLVAVAIGSVAGGLIGKEIGRSLDQADRQKMARASQVALEKSRSGDVSTWTNPDTGNSGTVKPTNAYKTASGENCREYQQTVTIGGKTQSAYGTACRQPDGAWKIVK